MEAINQLNVFKAVSAQIYSLFQGHVEQRAEGKFMVIRLADERPANNSTIGYRAPGTRYFQINILGTNFYICTPKNAGGVDEFLKNIALVVDFIEIHHRAAYICMDYDKPVAFDEGTLCARAEVVTTQECLLEDFFSNDETVVYDVVGDEAAAILLNETRDLLAATPTVYHQQQQGAAFPYLRRIDGLFVTLQPVYSASNACIVNVMDKLDKNDAYAHIPVSLRVKGYPTFAAAALKVLLPKNVDQVAEVTRVLHDLHLFDELRFIDSNLHGLRINPDMLEVHQHHAVEFQ